jgi:CheY-like chemotaxis protein
VSDETATVLAVDDETENTEIIRRVLASRKDLRVLVAFSAREALAVLQSHHVDVMLLDQRMPNGTGAELVERAMTLGKKVATIMVTTYPEEPEVANVLRRGLIYCVVAKPWRAEDLFVALDLALRARAKRQTQAPT